MTLIFERITSGQPRGKLGTIQVAADIKGEFEAYESPDDAFLEENMIVLNELDARQFPIDLAYRQTKVNSYLISLDDETLLKESPMTVYGKCLYTATYISTHHSDPSRNPSSMSEMIPEYSSITVRATGPIPVHSQEIENFCKPRKTVQVVTQEQFDYLLKTIASHSHERNRLPTCPLPGRRLVFRLILPPLFFKRH